MPADPHDYRVLQSFLDSVGRISLMEYLGLPEDPDARESVAAVRARRRWAQAWLTNPRYQAEAQQVIRHKTRMERVLCSAIAQPEDRGVVHSLRTFWSGLAMADVPQAERLARLTEEAQRLGVSQERMLRLLVVGTVTHVPHRAPQAAPQPAAVDPAPAQDQGDAAALAEHLAQVVERGSLPLDQVEGLLRSAKARCLTPAATLVELDAAVQAAKQAAESTQDRARLALQATLSEVCESVRGLALQGLVTDRSLRAVARHARRQGLPADPVHALLHAAQTTEDLMAHAPQTARALLAVSEDADRAELDHAWTAARAKVDPTAPPWQEARRVLSLDLAWAILRRSSPGLTPPTPHPRRSDQGALPA